MLLWLFPLFLADTARLPWSCGPNHGCVCQHQGTFDVTKYSYNQCQALSSWDGCIYCSKDSPCNATSTPEGLYCWPHVKECSMCASPTSLAINNLLAPNYTLYLRHRCTATSLCHEDTRPIQFSPNMTIIGGTGSDLIIDGMGHTLEGPCPMFVFESINSLVVRDLTINCNATTQPETAPGILVSNVVKLVITIKDVTVTGIAKSAVTVLGGQFQNVVPITSADLGGSSFSGVELQNSFYRQFMDVTLAMYYGDVDVSGMARYRRFMIQPSVDPKTGVPSAFVNSTSGKDPVDLIINNFTEWTRMMGVDYEIILNDRGTLGFTLIESKDEQTRFLRIGVAIVVGGALYIQLRYWGPVSYMYKLAKSTS